MQEVHLEEEHPTVCEGSGRVVDSIQKGDLSKLAQKAATGSAREIRRLCRYMATSDAHDDIDRLFTSFYSFATKEAQEAMWRWFCLDDAFSRLLEILDRQGGSIRTLSFHHDRFRDIGQISLYERIASIITRCPRVQNVTIKGPKLDESQNVLLNTLSKASFLEALDLSDTCGFELDALHLFSRLRSLCFTIDDSKGFLPEFTHFSRLEVLRISGHLAVPIEVKNLRAARLLHTLELPGMGLSSNTLGEILELKSLSALKVILTDPYELKQLGACTTLTKLYITCWFSFQFFETEHLRNLTRLCELIIYLPHNDHVSILAMQWLLTKLPLLTSLWVNKLQTTEQTALIDELATIISKCRTIRKLTIDSSFKLSQNLANSLFSHPMLTHLYVRAPSMPMVDVRSATFEELGVALQEAPQNLAKAFFSIRTLRSLELSFPLYDSDFECHMPRLQAFTHNPSLYDSYSYGPSQSWISKTGLQKVLQLETLQSCGIHGTTQISYNDAIDLLESATHLRSFSMPGVLTEIPNCSRPQCLRHLSKMAMSVQVPKFWDEIGKDLQVDAETPIEYVMYPRRLPPPPFQA